MVERAEGQGTLLDVLAEAGGITSDAGESVVITGAETDPSDDAATPPAISPEDAAPTAPATGESSPAPSASQPVSPSSAVPPSNPIPATQIGTPSAAANGTSSDSVPPPLSNTITVNLNQILETGNTSSNIVLMPSHILPVPHAAILFPLASVTSPAHF